MKKAGRKRLSKAKRRGTPYSIRFTAKERRALEKEADMEDKRLPQLIRERVLRRPQA